MESIFERLNELDGGGGGGGDGGGDEHTWSELFSPSLVRFTACPKVPQKSSHICPSFLLLLLPARCAEEDSSSAISTELPSTTITSAYVQLAAAGQAGRGEVGGRGQSSQPTGDRSKNTCAHAHTGTRVVMRRRGTRRRRRRTRRWRKKKWKTKKNYKK